MLHHVQLACPPGHEDQRRSYYIGVLGMAEKEKPLILTARGGCWFSDEYLAELHLGVEADFCPARKAHPALIRPDLDALAARIEAAGYPVVWCDDEVPGMRRFHTEDCLGNRLEFVLPDANRQDLGKA